MNWYFGWASILAAFLTGAILGLFFEREDFLGGYTSFRRRLLRLGHIALAALGMLNILYGLTPAPVEETLSPRIASIAFIVGGVTMPALCFLTAWRTGFRKLFFIPVAALIVAVIETLRTGIP
jgi:hypothetical protein